ASGVRGLAVTSTAIGGTSVMRVSFGGDLAALAAALRARGFTVREGAEALSISL
ncbi:MAG: heavy-metal-associated domain-containing protein, partial [Erythrobacter sp.]